MFANSQLSLKESTANSIPNYMTAALLCTILGLAPFGVVAMLYAARVNAKKEENDLEEALVASRKARWWCRAAIIAPICLAALYLLFVLLVLVLSIEAYYIDITRAPSPSPLVIGGRFLQPNPAQPLHGFGQPNSMVWTVCSTAGITGDHQQAS